MKKCEKIGDASIDISTTSGAIGKSIVPVDLIPSCQNKGQFSREI